MTPSEMVRSEMMRRQPEISPILKCFIAVVAAFLFACSGPGRSAGESAQSAVPEPAPQRPQVASVASAQAPEPARAPSAPEAVREPEQGEAAPVVAPAEEPSEEIGSESAEEEPRPVARRARSGERVYSNEDLKKYSHLKEEFGFREGTVVADLSQQQKKSGDTFEKPKAAPMTRDEWDREYRAAFKEVERLTEELKYLEARAASLHNPLLPRAKVNDADQLAESGMDNKERLERVNEQIAKTQRDLSAAKQHFGQIQENVPPQPPSADQ